MVIEYALEQLGSSIVAAGAFSILWFRIIGLEKRLENLNQMVRELVTHLIRKDRNGAQNKSPD